MVRRNDNDPNPPPRRLWHFEKSISVGHLLTTLTIGGSILLWALGMETRIIVLENAITHQKDVNARMEKEVSTRLDTVSASLIRIEEKMYARTNGSP